jgi:hypothetical protein
MKRVSPPKRQDKAKPTAADRRLARKIVSIVPIRDRATLLRIFEAHTLASAARVERKRKGR